MRFLILPALLASTSVLAQEPEIVVTGMSLPQAAGDIAYDVVTIGRDRLTGSASGRIEDVLRDAAGFQQFRRSDSRSAHPTSQGATLRGLGGNASSRALVLLDGVPQIDPFGGWVNFPALDPVRIGLARVTRGGGTGAFGPGALAGTVELSSAGPADLPAYWAGAAFGSRDSVDADAGVSARLGGGFASLSGAYARGDGFTPTIAGQRGAIDRPARYKQYSAAARAVAPLAPDIELQAAASAFHDARDRGTDFTTNVSDGFDASLRLVGRGRWGFEALAYFQDRRFASDFASIPADRNTVTQSLDQYAVPATGKGGRVELRPPLAEGLELRLGADLRALSGQTKERYSFVAGSPTRRREAGGETLTAGAFADGSAKLGDRLTLTGGARVDRWRIRDGFLRETLIGGAAITDNDTADRSGWRPTGRAGIAFRPTGAITLRSAAYLGWRLPTLNELYRPFRAGADATAANAGLEPERLKGVDAGIDLQPFARLRLSATVFANRLEDGIANVTNPRDALGNCRGIGFVAATGACRIRRNLDAVRSRGVELDGQWTYARWDLSASYAYADARVSATGASAALDGLRPAQTPKHQASATIAWTPQPEARAAVTLRYIGSQFEDDQNSRSLDDALTADAVIAMPLRRGVVVEARAENVFDKTVEATVSGTGVIERATPRTLWLGLRVSG
ncbi:TonB-dependent receptor [Sphingomonas sp. ID0503]|uniref:TonB-dependent receptor n=1 Tax=Sphingomonas sp. ID0503 TaxID=3399691 RepID=UPI003AFA2271